MLILLCVSFVTLKLKIKSFPEANQDEDSIKRVLWMGIAVSLSGLTHVCFSMILSSHSPIALTFINQFLCNSIVKVGFKLYFICKTPNLQNYVRNFFKNRIDFLCFLHLFSRSPNQIDCIL